MVTERYRAAVQAVRREEILRAAILEIGRNGLAQTTMERCARAAGVAKGTLYLHFKDKDDLTAAAIEWGLNGLKRELEQIAAEPLPVAQRLRLMLLRQLEFFDSNRHLYRAFLEEKGKICGNPKDPVLKRLKKGREGYIEFIVRIISEGMESGEFRKFPKDKIALIWVEMVGGVVVHRLTSAGINSIEEDADMLLDLFLYGAIHAGKATENRSSRRPRPQHAGH